MSVATRTAHIIRCDAMACVKRVQSWTGLAVARSYAERAGWVVASELNEEDYCPMHAHLGGQARGNDAEDPVRTAL